jgi:ribose transport system substrate-binding protein
MARQPTPRHLKLALLTWTEDPFWGPLLHGAQEYADQANVDLTIVRSKPTVEEQNQHIRDLLASGVDGIAISPNDAHAQLDILNEVAAKIPLVTFDTDAPESKRRRFVGIDNYAAGRFCADEVREAMPDGGPILISVGSATMQHGRDRRQGLIDGLLERGFDRGRAADPLDAVLTGPKYSVVATVTDGADPPKAVLVIADALRAHPEVKGIVGLFSYSAPAALAAMKKVGREGQLKVVGFDESDETQAAIMSGAIHSSILQDSHRAGYEAIEVLANEVRGVGRGPAEQSPILNVDINVLTSRNLLMLRESGAIRQPTIAAATQAMIQ